MDTKSIKNKAINELFNPNGSGLMGFLERNNKGRNFGH